MRGYLVAGNWKMHGDTAANAELVGEIIRDAPRSSRVDLLVCPPSLHLHQVREMLRGSEISLGAQTMSEHQSGAYTGEIAGSMLSDLGCSYVIVGHSERRALFAESSEIVARKFSAAQSAGLIPILCVGETLQQRDNGETQTVIDEQLGAVFDLVGVEAFVEAVIAYEPVWAIGTGKVATPEQAQSVHRHIRSELESRNPSVADGIKILYGGSVKGENAGGLFSKPDIDGGLIGGASLNAADFLAIAEAAVQLN